MTEQETAPSPSVQPNNSSATSERLLVLGAGRADRNYWSDLWSYRELFAILAWRDLVVRYKHTVIGAPFAVVCTLLTIVSLRFSNVAR